MDRSLEQIYTLMLMHCGWVERHEILLNSDGWAEEHVITTIDDKRRGFEIKFAIDVSNGHIEVYSVAMNRPRVDNYTFHMDHMCGY